MYVYSWTVSMDANIIQSKTNWFINIVEICTLQVGLTSLFLCQIRGAIEKLKNPAADPVLTLNYSSF